MMNKQGWIIVGIMMLIGMCWSFAVGGNGEAPVKMAEDKAFREIQGIAPDPRKDIVLTGNSQTIEVTNDASWKCYSPTGGIYRTMSSATKVGTAHSLPTSQWHGEVVNRRFDNDGKCFLNISGAVASGTEKATCRRH